MSDASVKKVVIIGSGPAGWTSAIYAARARLEPVVYEGALSEENRLAGTLPLGQLALTTEVENFPGFPKGINGPDLMQSMRDQAEHAGAEIITEDILEVDLSQRPFVLVDSAGKVLKAHAIIIATGASAKYLGLASENEFKNRGVSACAVCDGALPRFRNQPVVVVGGGDTACEEADYLSKFASTVHLVYRKTREKMPASQVMQERIIGNPKANAMWNSVVEEVIGDDKQGVKSVRVKNLTTGDSMEVPTAGLFVAIGHSPNTKFLKGQIKTNAQGYVELTDPFRTLTSVEGVFAAGDVADATYRQAITAAGMGCKAALDAERWLAAKGIH